MEWEWPEQISHFYRGLIDWKNQDECPLARMMVASEAEKFADEGEQIDPIGDHVDEVVSGLIHRYPKKVLLILSHRCAGHCRYCFRKASNYTREEKKLDLEAIANYIKTQPQVNEIIFSGGEPLLANEETWRQVKEKLQTLPQLKIWRWHSRLPVFAPELIDDEKIEKWLVIPDKKVKLIIHVNHIKEISPQLKNLAQKLQRQGIELASQSVLLKGVNDQVDQLKLLFEALKELNVQPYRLYHPDQAPSTAHFRVSVDDGKTLWQAVKSVTKNTDIPEYMMDLPKGRGKVPVMSLQETEMVGEYKAIALDGQEVIYNDLVIKNQWLKMIKVRARVIKIIRDFFQKQDFQELICPLLWSQVPAEPTMGYFETKWRKNTGEKQMFLPASPEKAMKWHLARGVGNCFTIGHCFRNMEDKNETHNPEFLMLEWYLENGDYQQVMKGVEQLLIEVRKELKESELGGNLKLVDEKKLRHPKKISIEEIWQKKFQMSLLEVESDEAMAKLARRLGYQAEDSTWEQNYNQIFLNEIESEWGEELFFVVDFPAKTSPLCAINPQKPWLAERFEVYLNKVEIGNGNNENLEVEKLRQGFQNQQKEREQNGEIMPIDEEYLSNTAELKQSGRNFAGVGLGVDRLVMLISGASKINYWWPE